jgi:NADP-dependent 3-hydroxy acid dehydrogenase YdfG/acyl carrier protein
MLTSSEAVAGGRAMVQERAAVLAGESWPPAGAEAVEVDDLYDELAGRGIEYGPAFSGLRAAWWHGEEMLAEVALSEDEREQASSFGVHPALLDGALQLMGVTLLRSAAGDAQTRSGVRLPFSFSGVELYASGASSLRVSVLPIAADAVSLVVTDEVGGLIASVDSLVMREVSPEQLGAARGAVHDSFFSVEWSAISTVPLSSESSADALVLLSAERSALAESLGRNGCSVEVHADLKSLCEACDESSAVPKTVFVDCALDGGIGVTDAELTANGLAVDGVPAEGVAARLAPADRSDPVELALVHRTVHRVLELVQSWLSDERFSDSRLALITQRAVAMGPGDSLPGLTQSPVWGLVRSAQAENPERFVLIDIDEETSSATLLAALISHEPQLVIRRGNISAPRLRRIATVPLEEAVESEAAVLDSNGTVLITGGTGALGALMARHLVSRHGVGHLLLVSRGGAEAQGASELQAELGELGAAVRIAACDVADRETLKTLVDSIPAEHPLTAVVHAAGVLDNGVIGSLTAERLDRALAPKADAAWYLHELTERSQLQAFVLFSSAAGMLGGPGQGNYAAANAFLDALAAYRRARGLPGSSVAWGLWEQASAMTEGLSETDRRRVASSGMGALSSERGLELFDAALGSEQALMLAAPLDLRVLRAQARTGVLPAMLGGLVRVPKRRSGEQGGSLARRLAATPEAEREGVVLDLVRTQVAAVLGHASSEAVEEQRAFKELGFDSLAAVELRNRLNSVTGLRLPATLVFDYPTPAALTGYLLDEVSTGDAAAIAGATASALVELNKLESTLSSLASDDLERAQIVRRLQALLSGLAADGVVDDDDLDTATVDEVFEAMDKEFGVL